MTPTGLLSAVTSMLPQFSAKTGATNASDGKYHRGYLFCLVMTLVPLSIFILFSLTKEIKLNWTGPLWLATLPFIAVSMVWGKGKVQQRVAGLWPKTMVVIMISYGALLHYCTLGLPANSFTKSVFLYGWDDLARQVDTLVDSSATPLLVVGMDKYRIASGLAFYLNKVENLEGEQSDVNETTGRQLFGQNALMYNFWCPPEQALARDILVISEDRDQLDPANFINYSDHLGPIAAIDITKRGKTAGQFFYRKLTAYKTNIHADLTSTAMPAMDKPAKVHDT